MQFNTKELMVLAIVAGLYIVLSLVVAPLSYGSVQLRIGEMLMILPFLNKKYSISLILGCFIVNLYSPLGLTDVIFGTTSTALMCLFVARTTNIWRIPFITAFFTGIMIGYELYLVYSAPLLITILSVAIGEFIVVLVGVLIFNDIEKRNNNIYNKIRNLG